MVVLLSCAQVMAKMEDEIREEMAEEMEKMMNQMEETYQAKLQRETAIHEEKFSVRQQSASGDPSITDLHL